MELEMFHKRKTVLLENALIYHNQMENDSKIESRQSTYTIAPQGMVNVSIKIR